MKEKFAMFMKNSGWKMIISLNTEGPVMGPDVFI
jgi:hypothetical protein